MIKLAKEERVLKVYTINREATVSVTNKRIIKSVYCKEDDGTRKLEGKEVLLDQVTGVISYGREKDKKINLLPYKIVAILLTAAFLTFAIIYSPWLVGTSETMTIFGSLFGVSLTAVLLLFLLKIRRPERIYIKMFFKNGGDETFTFDSVDERNHEKAEKTMARRADFLALIDEFMSLIIEIKDEEKKRELDAIAARK